jgi:membrane-associated phospholipid phosphatase
MRARAQALVLLLVTLLAVVAVVLLARAVGAGHGALPAFDRRVSAEAHAFGRAHRLSVDLMWAVGWLGTGGAGLLALVPAVVRFVRTGRGAVALYAVACVALTPLVIEPVERVVHRPRPQFADPFARVTGYSFPSGHSVHIVTYALVVAVLLPPAWPRRWRVAVVGTGAVAVLAVGWSRVALGAHYPSDVLAGWALGTAWVAATTLVFVPWRRALFSPLPCGTAVRAGQRAPGGGV